MKPTPLFPGLIIVVFLLSACQPSVELSAQEPYVYCNGQFAWSAEEITDDMTHYTIFWVAFESSVAQNNFQYIDVDVTLDGKPVDSLKFMQAPEPYSINCSDTQRQFEAIRVMYTQILPPMDRGVHKIVWMYTITGDLSDIIFDQPQMIATEYPVPLYIN